MREAALTDRGRIHPTWNSADTLPHLVHSITVMLEAPPREGLFEKTSRKAKQPRSIVGSIGMILD
jgi:hypothetical protein